jgi:hypothetical protein
MNCPYVSITVLGAKLCSLKVEKAKIDLARNNWRYGGYDAR